MIIFTKLTIKMLRIPKGCVKFVIRSSLQSDSDLSIFAFISRKWRKNSMFQRKNIYYPENLSSLISQF